MRIDKYLWCIRVFKTRTQAADACKAGKVWVNEQPVKAAYEVKKEDRIKIRVESIYKKWLVLDFPKNRCAAKDTVLYAEEQTDPAELEKLKAIKLNKSIFREPGTGRPTKKDRRDMYRFFND